MRSQKEITLREELDQKDRVDIYRNFLLYCMSGNVINIGMGTSRTPPTLLFCSLSAMGLISVVPPLEQHTHGCP